MVKTAPAEFSGNRISMVALPVVVVGKFKLNWLKKKKLKISMKSL